MTLGYALAVNAMVSPNGYRVEQITVQKHLSARPRRCCASAEGTSLVEDCRTVEEVARLVGLATPVPEQQG